MLRSANSGWWTAFAKPFASGQWTLRNYERVILADNMGNAFLNSLPVAIPSTVIPITIAAFAAYAIRGAAVRLRQDAVHRLQGARHLQVREHRPHSVLLCRHSCG